MRFRALQERDFLSNKAKQTGLFIALEAIIKLPASSSLALGGNGDALQLPPREVKAASHLF